MTRLQDFSHIGYQGPRLRCDNTEIVGGSWMARIMDSGLLNPQPIYNRAVGGEGIQDHASKVARNDATEDQWPEPLSRDLLWPLGANDTTFATTPSNIHNNVFSILAVAAWVAGGGEFYPSDGGLLSSVYTDYGRMQPSSAEGSGVTCVVRDTPGWYVLFYTTSDTERIEGKIEENGRTVDLGWNTAAYEDRGFARDVVGLPYYSDTGRFNVEMWSSLASGYGVFMGVRKIEGAQSVVIPTEIARWDLTDANSGDRYPAIDLTIRTFGALWSLMGGGFYNMPLPTLGYLMSDTVHLNQTSQTTYLHAQFINQVLC